MRRPCWKRKASLPIPARDDRVIMRNALQARKPPRLRCCHSGCPSCQAAAKSDVAKTVPTDGCERRPRCSRRRRRRNMTGHENVAMMAAAIMAVSAADSSSSSSSASSSSYAFWPASAAVSQTAKGTVLTEDFCQRNYMQISRLSLLCNTPGAYYHGSNAYRNSEVCMSGDKAILDVNCMYGHAVVPRRRWTLVSI
jgi:hypothetical protein